MILKETKMEKKTRKLNIDIYLGAILILFSAYLYFESTRIKPESAKFPQIVIMLLLALSVIVLILGIRKTIRPELTLKSDTLLNLDVIQTPVMVFVLIAAYIAVMNFAGFFIATALFVPVMMVYYGNKNIRTIIITDIALNLFVYLLFVKTLNVMLP
jgi:hypothetical protein